MDTEKQALLEEILRDDIYDDGEEIHIYKVKLLLISDEEKNDPTVIRWIYADGKHLSVEYLFDFISIPPEFAKYRILSMEIMEEETYIHELKPNLIQQESRYYTNEE